METQFTLGGLMCFIAVLAMAFAAASWIAYPGLLAMILFAWAFRLQTAKSNGSNASRACEFVRLGYLCALLEWAWAGSAFTVVSPGPYDYESLVGPVTRRLVVSTVVLLPFLTLVMLRLKFRRATVEQTRAFRYTKIATVLATVNVVLMYLGFHAVFWWWTVRSYKGP